MTTEYLTGLARAHRYADQVLAGKLDVPKPVHTACDRWCQFHKEFKIDEERLNTRIEMIEKLDMPEGRRGKLILRDWQCFALSWLFLFVDEDGARAIHRMTLCVPRKVGKTTLAAGACFVEMISPLGDFKNPEIIITSVSEEAAGMAFSKIRDMIGNDRAKGGSLQKKLGVNTTNRRITCDATGGEIKMVSGNARQLDGYTSNFIFADEIANMKDTSILDKLFSGMGHTKDHCLLCASTHSEIPANALIHEREIMLNLLNDKEEKKFSYVGLLYENKLSDPWWEPETWFRVNPSLEGDKTQIAFYEEQVKQAKYDDRRREHVQLRLLCTPMAASSTWVPAHVFDSLPKVPEGEFPPKGHRKMRHYLGLDVGDTLSASTICLLSVKEDDTWIANFWVFMSDGAGDYYGEDGNKIARLNATETNKRYAELAKKGHVIVTPGPVINHQVISEQIKAIADKVNVNGFYTDVYHAAEEVRKFLPPGIDKRLLTIPKSVPMQSPALKAADARLRTGRVTMSTNPVVREHFLNSCITYFENGGQLLGKSTRNSRNLVDAADAFIHAVIGMQYTAADKFIGTIHNPINNEADDAEDGAEVVNHVIEF